MIRVFARISTSIQDCQLNYSFTARQVFNALCSILSTFNLDLTRPLSVIQQTERQFRASQCLIWIEAIFIYYYDEGKDSKNGKCLVISCVLQLKSSVYQYKCDIICEIITFCGTHSAILDN